ncbi:MAG: hypothetical protein IKJ19_02765 [Clostridia bacterium]|nr:hypothetical protein [Clostridia bacterium]
MKYTKKINKHYEYLSQEGYLNGITNPIEFLKCASAYLEGGCCHFFACNKNVDSLENVVDRLNELAFSNKNYGDLSELVNVYSNLLTALCAYKLTHKTAIADALISKCANYLLSCGFDLCDEKTLGDNNGFFKTLCMANSLSEYYALIKNVNACALLDRICYAIKNFNLNDINDNCFDYLTLCLGLVRYAKFSGKMQVNELIEGLFDNFLATAQSLNYASSKSFKDKSETDSKATARSLEVALGLLDNTKDSRYLTIARRIWFNGMQFCQRDVGQVGSDTFTNENTRLKIKEYQIKQITTPLYAGGLKCYNLNKGLFEEQGNIVKDRRGRIFLGDKMFAKDVSGFFGKDLIEIPTLTAFDKETNLQLDLQILF